MFNKENVKSMFNKEIYSDINVIKKKTVSFRI